jgi:biotin carboxyl carrier protein
MKYQLEINRKNFDVTIAGMTADMARVVVNGQTYDVRVLNSGSIMSSETSRTAVEQPVAVPERVAEAPAVSPAPAPVQPAPSRPAAPVAGPVDGEPILAPIPGLILEIKVKVGDAVAAGQTVAVMEAMKMENSLVTHVDGIIRDIRVQKGSEVSTGDVILVVG